MIPSETPTVYLDLPEDWIVIHVTEADSIGSAREALEHADVVGIDAEWEPYSKTASASLVQIAARNETRTCIVLLDLQAVGASACKDLLQELFRDKAILKVGFGILMDLKAVATAIGGEGAGCVSVVQPYVDLKTLHRQLSASNIPGIGKETGRGLSGIVEAQLGVSLDKSLQCSSWGARPLSPEQLKYAALDAAVLLMLLDSIIAAALPSKVLPGSDAAGRHSAGVFEAGASIGHMMDRAGAHTQPDLPEHSGNASLQLSEVSRDMHAAHRDSNQHLQSTESPGALSENGPASLDSRHQHSQQGEHLVDCSASGAREMTRTLAGLSLDPSQDSAASPQHRNTPLEGTASPPAASAAELQEAAQVWGTRLEVGGSCRQRPQKLSKDKRPGVREQFRQDSADSDSIAGHPASIPWLQSGSADAVPRFICDSMTEGLARQLRLCGIDARSAPGAIGCPRYRAYMELSSAASSEQRVVLTADTVFLRARYTDQAYWVRSTNKRDQLLEVLEAFNIEVREGSLLSRCAKCNGTFIPRPLTKAQLPATCILSEGVRSRHDCFYMCSNKKCQKIYWQGNQYGNALQNLTARVLKQPQQLQLA